MSGQITRRAMPVANCAADTGFTNARRCIQRLRTLSRYQIIRWNGTFCLNSPAKASQCRVNTRGPLMRDEGGDARTCIRPRLPRNPRAVNQQRTCAKPNEPYRCWDLAATILPVQVLGNSNFIRRCTGFALGEAPQLWKWARAASYKARKRIGRKQGKLPRDKTLTGRVRRHSLNGRCWIQASEF